MRRRRPRACTYPSRSLHSISSVQRPRASQKALILLLRDVEPSATAERALPASPNRSALSCRIFASSARGCHRTMQRCPETFHDPDMPFQSSKRPFLRHLFARCLTMLHHPSKPPYPNHTSRDFTALALVVAKRSSTSLVFSVRIGPSPPIMHIQP